MMGIFDKFKKKKNDEPKTAQERKTETEALLLSLNIPYIPHLPFIEEEWETKIRAANDIAERIIILTYLNYIAEVPEERETVVGFLKEHFLWDKVSPNEKFLFQKTEFTEQENIDISWRSEAIWLLLWTICKVDKLELPVEEVDINQIVSRLPKFLDNPEEFIQTATVRATAEILDVLDLTYRLHWAARDAGLSNQPMPADLNSSIIEERHYALNWVTFYAKDWDEISTDT